MPLLSKNSLTNPASTHPKGIKWAAAALPLAMAIGCSGLQNRTIIDYTVSEAEYQAAIAPPVVEEIIAAAPTVEPANEPVNEPIIAAAKPAAPEPAKEKFTVPVPATAEPVIAAAKPAAAVAPVLAPTPAPAAPPFDYMALSTPAIEPAPAPAPAPEAVATPVAAEPQLAAAIDFDSLKFSPSIYATAGLGVSRTNPDTSAAPQFQVADEIAASGQVAIGVDLARFLSVELHSADLGSTALSPEGRVNFHVNGASALLYAGKNKYRRQGWNGYARVGYNQIENTLVGNTPFLDQTSNKASFGLGAEYNTRRGLGVRADVIAFDGDVQYGQLGVLYRVAKKPKRPLLAAAPEAPLQPVVEPLVIEDVTPAVAEIPAVAAATTEKHIMPKASMEKPAMAAAGSDITMPRIEALSTLDNECSKLNGTMNNVTFMNGSARLTQQAAIALNSIARTLNNCADQQIVVSAHTDNSGSAETNNHLSKLRARTVATYLGRRGVSMNRMRAVAYGESRPISSNATAEGRRDNRRVELEVK